MKRNRLTAIPSITKRVLSLAVTAILILTTIATAIPKPVSADAVKTLTGGAGPYAPGSNVTVQINIPKPSNITISPFEIVFVVDASGSMSTQISDAKSRMVTFANWLSSYYGYAKVGVVSFGYEGSNPSRDPSIRVHYPLTMIDSSTDRNNLINGINAIQTNPPGYGFSDIRAGIQSANNILTTGSASGKYIVLVTDGINNMPTSESYYLGPWSGQCVLNTNRTANISSIRYSHLLVVATGNDLYNQVPSSTGWGTVPGLDKYVPPCQQYIWTNGSRTGSTLINDIVNYFPGTNSRSSTINEPILAIQEAITPDYINVQDIINTDIFSSIPSAGNVVNCSTGTVLSSNATISGRRINATINYYPGVNNYCMRFTATLASGAPSGTHTINSGPNASSNWIRFYNANGTIIARDGIQLGSMSILANPDMATTELWFTNSSGSQKRVFDLNENVYVHTQITNVGDSTMPAGFKTAFYSNSNGSTAPNTASNIPMYIIGHGALGAGGSRSYDSFNGGNFPSTSDPNTVTGNPRSWSYSSPGDRLALAFTNYSQAASEEVYPTNNRRSLGYSVITPPSNLRTSNLLCYRTDLLWNAGSSNITGYDVSVIDTAAMLAAIMSGTPYNDYVSYNPSVPASPTTMSASNLKPSTLYSWILTPRTAYGTGNPVSVNFTTPACPDFTTDIGGPYALNPGQPSDTIVNVNIDYLPSASVWTQHGARLTIGVVGINYNNASCAAYSANGAPFVSDRDGLTARVSGNPGLASRTVTAPTNPVPFTIQSTTNTNTGRYTVCFGIYSPDSYVTRTEVKPVHINVELQPWIQVDRPASSTGSLVGDVHSNASIDISIPLNQYFFRDGTAGVVSSTGSVSNIPNNRLSNITDKLWRIPNYSQQVKTEAYSNLESLAVASLPNPANGLPSGLPSTASITAQCSSGGGVFKHTPGSGTLTRSEEINLSSQGCAGRNLVYFIDGNLTHGANIIDDTNNATITFIVKGDVVVSPSVTRLDGVHIFGESFRDGSIYNTTTGTIDQPLIINGSLIGLATQSPISTKGTFSQGTFSGLQRNLSFGPSGNDNVPAERIVYQPKYLYMLRNLLGTSSFTWSE